jgi:hypothetical protein
VDLPGEVGDAVAEGVQELAPHLGAGQDRGRPVASAVAPRPDATTTVTAAPATDHASDAA